MTENNDIKNNRRPTSFDVARTAGVSRSTVSLVFNNVGGSRVSDQTRERILDAAHDLGYQPDRAASALRKGYSDEIAFLVPEEPTGSVTAQGLVFAQKRAIEIGYSLGIYLFYNLSRNTKHKILKSIAARRPVAIIGSPKIITREDFTFLKEMGVKVCILTGFEPEDFAFTQIIPVKQAFYLAAIHLLERGHRRLVHLVPRIPNPIEKSTYKIIEEGLRSAVDAYGGSLIDIPMDLDIGGANAAVERISSDPNPPTGIIGNRDEYCFILLKALAVRGIRVPQDLAIVGINDSPFCTMSNPSLTSISFDIQTAMVRTVNSIAALIHDQQPDPDWLVYPSPRLVIRDSS